MAFSRIFIDWKKTAANLEFLRRNNLNLRRRVCQAHKMQNGDCEGVLCDDCKYEMDNLISQDELAYVLGVSSNIIANWENGRSTPTVEDIINYAKLCDIEVEEVIVFKK